MRYINFTFGGEEIQVLEPTYKQARAWRGRFEEILSQIAGLVEADLMKVLQEASDLAVPTSTEEISQAAGAGQFDQAAALIADISPTLGQVAKLLLSSVDQAADLVFSFGPDMMERREAIEEVAYSDEIFTALIDVVKVAYPFLTIRRSLAGLLAAGQVQAPITMNLPDHNGAMIEQKAN